MTVPPPWDAAPGAPDPNPYPGHPPAGPVAPRRRAKPGDLAMSSLMLALIVAATAWQITYSFLLVYLVGFSDCSRPEQCGGQPDGPAFLIGWGGVAVAWLVAGVGFLRGVSRGERIWPWSLIALVITASAVATLYFGTQAAMP